MSELIEFQGKNLDEAIENACKHFNLSRNKLEIEIIGGGSSGIFGLMGVRKAKIKAKPRTAVTAEDIIREGMGNGTPEKKGKPEQKEQKPKPAPKKENKPRPEAQEQKPQAPEKPAAPKAEAPKAEAPRQEAAPRNENKPAPAMPKGGSGLGLGPVHKPGEKAVPRLAPSPAPVAETTAAPATAPAVEPVAEPVKQEARPEPQKPEAPKPVPHAAEEGPIQASPVAYDFDADIEDDENGSFDQMADLDKDKLEAVVMEVCTELLKPIVQEPNLQVSFDNDRVRVFIDDEENSGLIIGREGQTLSSLQYLVNRLVSRKMEASVRIQVDTGDYRERQDEKLKQLALHLADKARNLGRTQSTKPLSSYHRRVVHLALQDAETVFTRSKGDGPMKRVLIVPKRKSHRRGPRR